jgi:predicted AAA+ superfamily ATPase
MAVAEADPARLLEGERPVLIDEWQRLIEVWDLVRRAVDDGAPPGSFLLTGSTLPDPPPTHSGAGRIVTVRMRPLAFSERLQSWSVSLSDLLSGERAPVTGATDFGLADYTDEVSAWIPANNPLRQLGQAPKHQLADPALAAQLLGVQAATLLAGRSAGPEIPRNDTLLGALFKSLATQSVRVYAAHSETKVRHLRTARGRQEVDLIVERADGGVLAIEIKLARSVDGDDVRHLNWLRGKLGDRVLDQVIVTTGPDAYRRKQDGIAVVPLALLGP